MNLRPNIEIIYQDKDLLAVNKPAGLLVHPAAGGEGPTLVDWLLENFPQIKGVGDLSTSSGQANLRPGIVHRLDKDTSGVLLVAKNQPAFEYLKKHFQDGEVKKKYIALVEGKLKNKEGIINQPIGKSRSDFRKKVSGQKITGPSREAVTEYKTKEEFEGFSLLDVFPKTGRTHQIRVHLKHLGHPVAGDRLYGFKNSKVPAGLERQFLHASSIDLALPSGGRIKIEADLPADLEKVLQNLRQK